MPVLSPPQASMDGTKPAATIAAGVIEAFSKVLANIQDRGYRVTTINNYLGELDDEDRRYFFDIPTRYALDFTDRAAVRGWLLAQRAEIEREIAKGLQRVRSI